MTLKQVKVTEPGTNYLTPSKVMIYNHAKFEGLPLNSVCQKVNVKVFVKPENRSVFSLEYVQKRKKIVVYSLST